MASKPSEDSDEEMLKAIQRGEVPKEDLGAKLAALKREIEEDPPKK